MRVWFRRKITVLIDPINNRKKSLSGSFVLLLGLGTVGSLAFFLPSGLWAQTLSSSTPFATQASAADDLYHRALEAYLDGNYDQSILFCAQSLEKDPSYSKSKNLLAVLTAEKEKATKTVIWLPSATAEPAPPVVVAPSAPAPDTSGIQKDVLSLQTKLDHFAGAQSRKYQEVSGQLQVIQELIKNNSDAQYAEVKNSQVEIVNRLQKVESTRGQDLRLLYVLCAASVFLSAGAVWRNSKKAKRT